MGLPDKTTPTHFRPRRKNQPRQQAAQLDIGAITHTGAAVESMRYANFSRDTEYCSVIGRITEPTVKQLK